MRRTLAWKKLGTTLKCTKPASTGKCTMTTYKDMVFLIRNLEDDNVMQLAESLRIVDALHRVRRETEARTISITGLLRLLVNAASRVLENLAYRQALATIASGRKNVDIANRKLRMHELTDQRSITKKRRLCEVNSRHIQAKLDIARQVGVVIVAETVERALVFTMITTTNAMKDIRVTKDRRSDVTEITLTMKRRHVDGPQVAGRDTAREWFKL